MKVLIINVVCGILSTGRICTDLAVEMEKQGHTVKIAYGRGNVPEEFQKYAICIGNQADVLFHVIKARTQDAMGVGSKRATKRFIEWIKRYNPDIIHLHNIHGYYIHIGILFDYLRSAKKRVIWTLHDCWAFTGHSVYCEEAGCKRWKEGCYKCPKQKEYPKSYLERSKQNWLYKKRCFTGIEQMEVVVPSQWLANLVKESFLGKYQIQVIHNGIDTGKFYAIESEFRKKYHIEEKRILLGVASTWSKLKGYNDFIELSKRLDQDFKIVLVGMDRRKSLPENIIGIKRTESIKELAGIYSSADLFLNLTYADTYPTVNLEALACGVPIISYDTGGSAEIVHDFGGIVVKKGDMEALVECIKKYKTGEITIALKQNRTEIINKIDKTVFIRKMINLYQKGTVKEEQDNGENRVCF